LGVPTLQTGPGPLSMEWTGMTPYRNLEQDQGGMSHLLESGMGSGVESGIAKIKNTPVSMSLYESVVNPLPTKANCFWKQESMYKVLTPNIKPPI